MRDINEIKKIVKRHASKMKGDFFIMNRDAKFYKGFHRGDIVWSDNQKEARTFRETSKVNSLKRWKPEECIEIVYCSEF